MPQIHPNDARLILTMPATARLWLGLGALLGSTGVIAAALLAHHARGMDATHHIFASTALDIQMWHALALLALAALRSRRRSRIADLAGVGFVLGTIVFCGAVYAAAFDAEPSFPFAPIGGTTLILSWAALAVSALRK